MTQKSNFLSLFLPQGSRFYHLQSKVSFAFVSETEFSFVFVVFLVSKLLILVSCKAYSRTLSLEASNDTKQNISGFFDVSEIPLFRPHPFKNLR